jgi:hypothetical protein
LGMVGGNAPLLDVLGEGVVLEVAGREGGTRGARVLGLAALERALGAVVLDRLRLRTNQGEKGK